MLLTNETLASAAPLRLHTSGQLRQAQESMARRATHVTPTLQLPLQAAAGCILASDLSLQPQVQVDDQLSVLSAGSKLDWRLLPLLSASGHGMVQVHAPVRCGLIMACEPTDFAKVRDLEVTATVIQAAFQQMGVRTFRTNVGSDVSPRVATAKMFSKYCDLILVVSSDSMRTAPGNGLEVPPVSSQLGRVCVILPGEAQAALCSLVSFVVPLVRRLQGRAAALPRLLHGVDAPEPGQVPIPEKMVWVCASGDSDTPWLRSSDPEPGRAFQALARASGVAWAARDLQAYGSEALAYLPFDEWLN